MGSGFRPQVPLSDGHRGLGLAATLCDRMEAIVLDGLQLSFVFWMVQWASRSSCHPQSISAAFFLGSDCKSQSLLSDVHRGMGLAATLCNPMEAIVSDGLELSFVFCCFLQSGSHTMSPLIVGAVGAQGCPPSSINFRGVFWGLVSDPQVPLSDGHRGLGLAATLCDRMEAIVLDGLQLSFRCGCLLQSVSHTLSRRICVKVLDSV